MTSRQTGRRMQTIAPASRRQARPGVRQRKNSGPKPGELRRLAQLVVCGAIFIALVAAKLLLPSRIAEFNEKLTAALDQNMDVQAVFSAVGRAFSGEGGVSGAMEEVYQAVFHPQETGLAVKTFSTRVVRIQDGGALGTLQAYLPSEEPSADESEAAPEDTEAEEGSEEQDASSLAYVMYSEENLPDSVSLEQAILGFDYTTPVMGVLTSDFGYREHPIEGEERFHYGVDLAVNSGTEIDCFADGTVTAVGESSSYGKYCIVAHEGGYSTLYAHCSRIVVTSGTEVSRGQKIAEVGETGMATGPHLHFELQRNGTYLNPIYYVTPA